MRASRGRVYACVVLGLVAISCALALQACSLAGAGNGFTTIILVRHAEKEPTGDDPALSEAGVERALALAHAVGEANVSAVYATQYERTQSTAVPLAESLGLAVNVISAGDRYAAEMAAIVHSRHHGEVVLIVSHSNTVPAVIGALGVGAIPQIDDDEYDDLYVVTITRDGHANLLPLRYGRATP